MHPTGSTIFRKNCPKIISVCAYKPDSVGMQQGHMEGVSKGFRKPLDFWLCNAVET